MNVLSIALREMRRRPRGLVTTLILTFCVLSMLVTVWTLRRAMVERLRRVTAQMGNNLLFIPRDGSIEAYYTAVGAQATMPQERAEFLATKCPALRGHATHYIAKVQARVPVNGAEVILTGFKLLTGRGGRRRSFLDDDLPTGEVLVGSEAARRAGLKAGDSVLIAGRSFKVRSVIPELGVLDDLRIWGRLGEVQRLVGAQGRIHGVDALGDLCSGPYLAAIAAEVDRSAPDLRFIHSQMIAVTRERLRAAIEGVGAVLVTIVGLLGAVAVFTATRGEVRERRGEIGILTAMGAAPRQILALFALKAALAGLAGGALGWAGGSALAVWIGPKVSGGLEEVLFEVLPGLLPTSAAIGAGFALLAGSLAIWRASRLDPVLALKDI